MAMETPIWEPKQINPIDSARDSTSFFPQHDCNKHLGLSMAMGVPKNGWFLLGKIPSFEMDDDWGLPLF